MLSQEAPATGTKDEGALPLVEVCSSVRERLESIARALGGLREEIDRALRDQDRPT